MENIKNILVAFYRNLLITPLIILSTVAHGQAVVIPTTDLQESLSETANISSSDDRIRALVSSFLFQSGFRSFTPRFEVYVPNDGAVCISYNTINDLYHGTRHYLARGRGWVSIDYSSESHNDVLERFGGSAFVASAHLMDDCNNRRSEKLLLPIRAVGSNVSRTEYYLIVHSDNQPTNIETYKRGTRDLIARGRCTSIKYSQQIAFDKICKIPAEAFDKTALTVLNIRLPGKLERVRVKLTEVSW